MHDPLHVRGSFYRSNLRLHAVKKGAGTGVRDMILRLVRARRGESGIIYCLSRKAAETTAEFLRQRRVRAAAYHAGLTAGRNAPAVQDEFSRDDLDVVCATIAFGMGIDKSNVRYVLHRDMPRSIEGYYQEIGRAGREGAPADCVLFYSWADVISLDRLIDNSDASTTRTTRISSAAPCAGCSIWRTPTRVCGGAWRAISRRTSRSAANRVGIARRRISSRRRAAPGSDRGRCPGRTGRRIGSSARGAGGVWRRSAGCCRGTGGRRNTGRGAVRALARASQAIGGRTQGARLCGVQRSHAFRPWRSQKPLNARWACSKSMAWGRRSWTSTATAFLAEIAGR